METTHQSLSPEIFDRFCNNLEDLYTTLLKVLETPLSSRERKTLRGANGIRYGFIQQVREVSNAHADLAPARFGEGDINRKIEEMQQYQDILLLLQEAERVAADLLLKTGHNVYQLSLLYYKSAQQMAKTGDFEATEVYDLLKGHFEKHGRRHKALSRKKLDADLHGLEQGTKEGKMVVERDSPETSGGRLAVVDDTK